MTDEHRAEPTLDEACRDLGNAIIDELHLPQLVDRLNRNRTVIWLGDTRVVRWLNLPADWVRTRRNRGNSCHEDVTGWR